jgi:hypothetical protein
MSEIDGKFKEYHEEYKDLKDFFAGERVVKEKGTRYTPMLQGHKSNPTNTTSYELYKAFGILYNALARTRQGLKGAILRKPVDITFPESQKEMLKTVMLNGASFLDLVRMVCDEVLGYGRVGVLVDIDAKEIPYVSLYPTLSIISWPDKVGEGVQQEIMLSEFIEREKLDDSKEIEVIEQRRKLEIDEKGFYKVTVYQKTEGKDGTWEVVPNDDKNPNPREPKYKGLRLNYIPFTFFGSSSNTPDPSRPPLLDLLNLSKGHWKLTVAYQYGLNFAGLPTPCFAGFKFEGSEIPLGPGAAHSTTEPQAKSWFLSTEGKGLSEMERGLDRLEKQMAIVGARLLEEQRPGVEAAETVRLRSSGDSATLGDIAGNVETGLTKVLKDIGFWLGVGEKECAVGVNKDFLSSRLTPQDITALLAAVQAGEISEDTFIYNLQQGEILQSGRTIEEEKEAIEEDHLKNQKKNKDLAGGFQQE